VEVAEPRAATAGPRSARPGDSHHANPWAADLYTRARARGHDHPHAVRILARAWLHIIWRRWQDHAPYDPAKHRAFQAVLDRAA
jgi:hypothetical protein